MIHTIRSVAVGDQESKIDSPIILYRGDREVEVEFTINGSKFTFTNGGNVIKSTNATHGQLVINTPTGENMFSEVTECHDGKVVFVITKEMIDELIEVGFYSFQIRLFDESQVSRVTIPPVLKGIDIRNPIAAEDETNVVDIGLVDYAVVVKDEFEDLSTFLPDGNYNKTEWESKDVISGAKLNKIEDALYNINSNMEATDLALLNRVENINKTIHGEIDKLGNELESEVEEFERDLNKNVELFKVDINADMTTYKDEISSRMTHVENSINITPDDFEGTDINKIQQALDHACENDINTIQLNRAYDLTGGTIYYNGGYAIPPTFKDGILIKNDSGFMFDRQANDNSSNSPLFFNVVFKGDGNHPCYIINGDKMIRQNFKNCTFRHIALISTSGYIQSLRLDNCEMSLSPDIFINCDTCYDVNITNNRFEESHKTLLKCYSESTQTFSNNVTRITNNLIEGYTYETPIILSSAYGLIIANNYFEYNNGDIEFVKSTGVNLVNGSINNNSFFRTKSNCHIKANGNNVSELYLNNNSTNIGFSNDKSFTIGLWYGNIKNTYLNGRGRLVPQGTNYETDGVSYTVFDNDGMSAIRIKPRSNTVCDIIDIVGRTYLIIFSGTYGSSVYYRATFTGILSVGGNWDSDSSNVCRELTINKLTSTNMNGKNDKKEIWDKSYVTAVFESTNTNKIHYDEDSDIIITFPNIPYNSKYTRATVKNLECLLTTSLNIENNIQK